jgi:hypothetical protein
MHRTVAALTNPAERAQIAWRSGCPVRLQPQVPGVGSTVLGARICSANTDNPIRGSRADALGQKPTRSRFDRVPSIGQAGQGLAVALLVNWQPLHAAKTPRLSEICKAPRETPSQKPCPQVLLVPKAIQRQVQASAGGQTDGAKTP